MSTDGKADARRAEIVRALLGLCAATLVVMLACPGARADVFTDPSLVSYGSVAGTGFVQQAEYAHDAAVSANGRYVAFDGSVGGVTGVWRRDLDTDVIEQVAGGDAAMPSISEEGRYVSFTTNEGASLPEITDALPDEHPGHQVVQVYRRDMDNEPATTAGEEASRAPSERAFLAASVASGSEEPLTFSGAGESNGAYAVGRTAMSASGSEVAFITSAVSNLVPYPALEEEERGLGEAPAPHTPAGQVAVHSFESGVTELVSRCRFECEQGSASGAAEPVVVSAGASPLGAVSLGNAEFPKHGYDGNSPGASISADGSTVAWLGESIAQQAPVLADERDEPYSEEPLWHRLPAASNETRRVTGGSDPEAPGCAASGELGLPFGAGSASDPCQGPFQHEQSGGVQGNGLIKNGAGLVPRLSGNGEEVLFGANARLVSEGNDFDRGEEGNPTDLFLASMSGETRGQALTPLTQVGPEDEAQSGEITNAEISPDGQQVAFTTVRTLFSLGRPTLVSPPAPEPTIGELFDADLADGTLTRITHGYESEGEQSQQPHHVSSSGEQYTPTEASELGALSPSFSASGDELVFTSTAANLVYGDGNSPPEPVTCCQAGDGSDVFAVSRTVYVSEAVPQSVTPAPPFVLASPYSLSATAQALSNGSIVVHAVVPGAGRVYAGARAGLAQHRRRPGHGVASRLVMKTVGENMAGESSTSGGLVQLTVRLRGAYSPLAGRRGGLPATLTVSFSSPHKATLTMRITVDFKRGKPARKADTVAGGSHGGGTR